MGTLALITISLTAISLIAMIWACMTATEVDEFEHKVTVNEAA
jgi:PDZ domain-containing secreted protein